MKRLIVGFATLGALIPAAGGWSLGPESQTGPADPAFGMSAVDMDSLAQEWPGAPIVLPTSLPPGYGWAGVGEAQGDGRTVWARTSQFVSVNGEPLVEVCAKKRQQARGCEGDGVVLRRSVEGFEVTISLPTSTRPADEKLLDFWSSVEMTTDYPAVTWLDQ
jgi:hypothetical protein